MTSSDLQDWQARMGYTNQAAADSLGMSRSGYQQLLAGVSRTTGRSMTIDRRTALACAALAAGITLPAST